MYELRNWLWFVLLLVAARLSAQSAVTAIVSYSPAKHFTEAMPLGNGRLGAMVFGNPDRERIALNEISLWSGGPQDADRETAYLALKPIQNLLLQGKNREAQELLMKSFTAKGDGTGLGNGKDVKYGSYQTSGNLLIDWQGNATEIQDYQRILDLNKALCTTVYRRNGIKIKQQVFTDFKNDVVRIKLSSDQPMPEFSLYLERKENVTQNFATPGGIMLAGQLPSGKEPGMKYTVQLKIMGTDGNMTADGNRLHISGASNCDLALDIATNYRYRTGGLDENSNPAGSTTQRLNNITHISFEQALAASATVYGAYFKRSSLKLAESDNADSRSTLQRLEDFNQNTDDPALLELYFNFGKYLLISSSRPGLLPANLQGLWAEEYQAPWNADYHLNINLQMNYWPAEVLNLSDLAEPLFRFTENLVPNGTKTAQKYYHAKGWVAHVVSNPWFFTSPGEGADWGSTLTGGAWLATHLWEHYRFTQDKKFLKHYYPVLKSSAEFLKDILIKEPSHGWLVTAPSNSPENTYIMPNGFGGNTCMGPTMDMQIARNIFGAVSSAAAILQHDKKFGGELMVISRNLAPNQIGSNGGIQEWLQDWPSTDPHHRHVSHLFGLYPYDEINSDHSDLFNAAKQTLLLRGDGGTGWSKAWKINFWARLADGDHAFKMLKSLLSPVHFGTKAAGGTYPNLFDAHPPFQIDGNFGAAAGIAEMLIQSHGKNEILRLLPALPHNNNFKSGKFTGFRARNNFEVSCVWSDFKVQSAEMVSNSGRVLHFYLPAGMAVFNAKNKIVAKASNADRLITLKTRKGQKLFVRR